ncbi:HTH domain-containing protein [Peribacillus huizhouensis]|uniref:Transcriptional regulator n=1 Tax=Peribacillus huizhouensis TaxID=1501239 RepID=A0ABR6CXI1_9BACI|nr:HTH domain-containing protein [Peribacillus huizhouensis]MBA9029398.1 hypothetical protein [Peribacillus huizhouensis]
MTIFVETSQFNQMISHRPYAESKNQKKKVKYMLLDSIKEKIGDRWILFKEGTRQAFDMICFFSAELGFFYAGAQYLADRHSISDRTIRNRFKELEELGQVVKLHRRSKRCNGKGKPVYLFVNHPYFTYWVHLLGLNIEDFHTDFHTENAETSCNSKEEATKKVSTYSLPLKQESNIYISDNHIMQAIYNRVNDAIKDGTTIKFLSSYVDRIFRSLEKQAIYAENIRLVAKKKQHEKEAYEFFYKPKEVPFYNWLEEPAEGKSG